MLLDLFAAALVAALIVALFTLVQPETPMFGFSVENGENIRATNLLVAGWFLVFSLPMFLYVRDRPGRQEPLSSDLFKKATGELLETYHELRRYRQVFRLLLARLIYNDGLVTVFSFGGIYAAVISFFLKSKSK